jgi:cytochrome oxidase Cu insertion factor (SCO1/SenC/PrrC family)
MLTFLKHKFTKREKFFAKWSAVHLAVAILAGGALALWLVGIQAHTDKQRVQVLKQDAAQSIAIDGSATDSPIPPNNTKLGGPFNLTSQDNKPVSDKDFAGKYLLVYFGYTSCPDMCPTGLQSMSRALDMLKSDADRVQPLFITVDPARDTPKKLKDYDSAFHPKIIGLTGSPDQIAAVAKEYQVYYQKGEGDQDYEVEHSSLIYLLDPNGNLVTTFSEEVDPKLIVAALQKATPQQP